MAGIGFVLRKLSNQQNLFDITHAYCSSIIVVSSPWIFTIFTFAAITTVMSNYISQTDLFNFQIIVIYTFSFSGVLSGIFTLITTRYLSDCIYQKDATLAPGMLLGTMLLVLVIQAPVVIWFYCFYLNIGKIMAINGAINFLLLSAIWMSNVFQSALRSYHIVNIIFCVGLFVALTLGCIFGFYFSSPGILIGFNIGLGLILALTMAMIFNEYPFGLKHPFVILSYFKKYWELPLIGIFYSLGCWVDKWIMWFARDSYVASSGFRLNPVYDGAMFLSYISIIPALGAFVFIIETAFFESYQKYWQGIAQKDTLRQIRINHRNLNDVLNKKLRAIAVFQIIFVLFLLLISPRIINLLKLAPMQLCILRFGIIASFFHLLFLIFSIIFSYFDNRKAVLKTYIVFFVSNTVFTLITMLMGFKYYGVGYLASCMVTFLYCGWIMIAYMKNLTYNLLCR